MDTIWMIKTRGDPLSAIRLFLYNLWSQIDLDGFVAPFYRDGEAALQPRLATDPVELLSADPFLPIVSFNAARLVSELNDDHLGARFGAVMRACEVRALESLTRLALFKPDRWLIIGVDCLASFTPEDFEWRLQRSRISERLSREMLHFARQGGIAPYRYRKACQMCSSPVSRGVDLSIGLLGMPVKKFILIQAKDEETAARCRLSYLTDGPATSAFIEQREQVLAALARRRTTTREWVMRTLAPELPRDAESMKVLLKDCAPCKECLRVCPIYSRLIAGMSNGISGSIDRFTYWLSSCAACGMCEQACPRRLPLTAVIGQISRSLVH
jgi:formate dehydrogenase subunit beta